MLKEHIFQAGQKGEEEEGEEEEDEEEEGGEDEETLMDAIIDEDQKEGERNPGRCRGSELEKKKEVKDFPKRGRRYLVREAFEMTMMKDDVFFFFLSTDCSRV